MTYNIVPHTENRTIKMLTSTNYSEPARAHTHTHTHTHAKPKWPKKQEKMYGALPPSPPPCTQQPLYQNR